MRKRKFATSPAVWLSRHPASVYFSAMKLGRLLAFSVLFLMPFEVLKAQAPTPSVVDSPNVKVLTGLYAQQFQEEMNLMVQALGVSCNTCHVRGNFASEEKPLKL